MEESFQKYCLLIWVLEGHMKASHQPPDFESPGVRRGSQLCLPAEEGHHPAELWTCRPAFVSLHPGNQGFYIQERRSPVQNQKPFI